VCDLCNAINDESLSPLVTAALVHAQFETIHPFDEGNGRTGRALIHVVLRRRRIAPDYVPPLSVILAAHRDDYIAALMRYREGDLAFWLEHFAVATTRSARLAAAYVEAVGDLMNDWRGRLAAGPGHRADAAAWAVIVSDVHQAPEPTEGRRSGFHTLPDLLLSWPAWASARQCALREMLLLGEVAPGCHDGYPPESR
jgi:hypothetical protein